VEARTWFNEELESKNFIVPGVVVMVMAMVGALLSSLTIAREWERGSMEQLISTPVTPLEILLGKLLPYFVIGLFETALCAAIGVWWFEVPFRGTLATLFVTSALFLVATLGVGFWFSVATKNQLMASQLALMATLLPSSLLSGFTFPIDQMPAPIRAVTYLVSSRYYVTILKSVFLKGTGVGALAGPVTALTIYACVIGFLAMRSFHKTLD
jgi:ABC-2 type transport system permease protein